MFALFFLNLKAFALFFSKSESVRTEREVEAESLGNTKSNAVQIGSGIDPICRVSWAAIITVHFS